MGCHFSGLGLKKGVRFCFLSPQIGLGFKNLRGIPLFKIRASTSHGEGGGESVDSVIVNLGQFGSGGRLDKGLRLHQMFTVSLGVKVSASLGWQYTIYRSSSICHHTILLRV